MRYSVALGCPLTAAQCNGVLSSASEREREREKERNREKESRTRETKTEGEGERDRERERTFIMPVCAGVAAFSCVYVRCFV